jgi:hypothetical protein
MTTGSARVNDSSEGGLRPWKPYFCGKTGRSGPPIPLTCLTCDNALIS